MEILALGLWQGGEASITLPPRMMNLDFGGSRSKRKRS